MTIGRCSQIGALSVVMKDVPPYSQVLGNPARVIAAKKKDAAKADTKREARAAPAETDKTEAKPDASAIVNDKAA